MKRKILLLMMTALLSVGAWAENLWSGNTTITWGEGVFKFETASKGLSLGDVLIFTISGKTTDDGLNICEHDSGNPYWSGKTLETISTQIGTIKMVVTDAIATAAETELWIAGNGFTITSVDLEKKQPTLNLYYNASGEDRRYYGGRLLTSNLFAAASVGDIVTIDISRVGNDDDPVEVNEYGENVTIYNKCPKSVWNSVNNSMDDPAGLTELTTLKVYTAPTTLSLVLTEELLANAKVNGLSLGGGNYNFTSVDLLYAHDVTIAGGITNGTVTASKSKAAYGETVTLTATPEAGYALVKPTVTDENSESLTVTDNGNGTYSFTMPATAVTVNATFTSATALSTDRLIIYSSFAS